MSHDAHDLHLSEQGPLGPPEYLKDRGGFAMPYGPLLFALVTIILSIFQGMMVVGFSPWGRVWPAEHSTTLNLPPAHLTP
jgi:hypothetical protein